MNKFHTCTKHGYGGQSGDGRLDRTVGFVTNAELDYPYISGSIGYCKEEKELTLSFHHHKENGITKYEKFTIKDVDLHGMYRILQEYDMGDHDNDYLEKCWS